MVIFATTRIKENSIKKAGSLFYVAWVSQLLKFIDKKSNKEITPEEVERFLKHLNQMRALRL